MAALLADDDGQFRLVIIPGGNARRDQRLAVHDERGGEAHEENREFRNGLFTLYRVVAVIEADAENAGIGREGEGLAHEKTIGAKCAYCPSQENLGELSVCRRCASTAAFHAK